MKYNFNTNQAMVVLGAKTVELELALDANTTLTELYEAQGQQLQQTMSELDEAKNRESVLKARLQEYIEGQGDNNVADSPV